MDFRSRCNTTIYPKIYAEINGLEEISEELSSLSGIQTKDREAIKERVLVFQEKNSKLVSDIEQLIENRYRLEHRNPEDFSYVDTLEDASENIQIDDRSDSLELLDADYAYLQAIMELRNRQITIASVLRGALPTTEAYEDTAQRGLEMLQAFVDRSKAKNRRDEWRIDQHFESARVLMSPETYRNQESTSPSDQP